VRDALNVAMQAMIAGERACEAAGRAAAVIMSGGGGFHRISIEHGPAMRSSLSKDFYGYNMSAPRKRYWSNAAQTVSTKWSKRSPPASARAGNPLG